MSKFSKELADEGISSVVVMHSSQEILQENQGQFMWSKAFEFIADPSREIYKKVGAEPNRWYLINPIFFLRAIAKFGPFAPQENKEIIKVTSKMRSGGEIHTQAPVDMILDTSTGQVMDIDYGKSPLDGWSPKEAEKRFKEVKIKQSYGEVPSITVQESND